MTCNETTKMPFTSTLNPNQNVRRAYPLTFRPSRLCIQSDFVKHCFFWLLDYSANIELVDILLFDLQMLPNDFWFEWNLLLHIYFAITMVCGTMNRSYRLFFAALLILPFFECFILSTTGPKHPLSMVPYHQIILDRERKRKGERRRFNQ